MKENTPTNISLEDIEDTPKSKVDIGATLRQRSQNFPLKHIYGSHEPLDEFLE